MGGDIRQNISLALGGSPASVVQLMTSDARALDGPDDQTLAQALGPNLYNSATMSSEQVIKVDSKQMERRVTDRWSKFTIIVIVGALAVFAASRVLSPSNVCLKR